LNFLFHIGFLEITWVDIVDICLVSAVLFHSYKLLRGTVAVRILLGFLLLYIIFLIVQATEMKLLTAILDKFMGVGVLAAVVLFQQEIRKFLLLLGRSAEVRQLPFIKLFRWRRSKPAGSLNVHPILEAMKLLGGTNTGALIVLSKDSDLNNYADTGDSLDAELSKRLMIAIFNKYSPLHDGALIIHKNRIKAARCILPVSENPHIPPNMGLRHRAGIGMSEITDTLVLLVSEETGQLSAARNGQIYHNLSLPEVRQKINEYMMENQSDSEKKIS
jgi:diadenylate cyclase